MQSIILLLQLVLVLLQGNPSPQAQALASQAVSLATQALAQQTTTIIMTKPITVAVPVNDGTGIGAPADILPPVSVTFTPIPSVASSSMPTSTPVVIPPQEDREFATGNFSAGPSAAQLNVYSNDPLGKGNILRANIDINGRSFSMIRRNGWIYFTFQDAGIATGTYPYSWHIENDQWFTDGSGTLENL